MRLVFSTSDWAGPSCGLAVALALVSALQSVPLEPRFAYTGEVAADGRVLAVGGLDDKLSLLHDSWASGALIVPLAWRGGGTRVHPVGDLEDAETCAFGTCYLDKTISEFEVAERAGRWVDAARLAELLLSGQSREDLTTDERLQLAVARLAAANHEGDARRGQHWVDEVRALVDGRLDMGLDVARAVGTSAVHHIDRVDFAGALRLFDGIDAVGFNAPARVHLYGPRALLAIAEGDFEQAVALRRCSLESAESTERARCLGDLADALRRAGRLDEALSAVHEGLGLARRPGRLPGLAARTGAYLALHAVRIQRALGDQAAAQELLAATPRNDAPDFRYRWELERILATGGSLLALRTWWDSVGEPLRSLPVFECLKDAEWACAGDPMALDRFRSVWPSASKVDPSGARDLVPY
jgi:tetratricopeptide (TPR) repeat protein